MRNIKLKGFGTDESKILFFIFWGKAVKGICACKYCKTLISCLKLRPLGDQSQLSLEIISEVSKFDIFDKVNHSFLQLTQFI